eukprot:CAMPEP_0198212580 /NCGR_PEP_ID=MMETSP1445-20131203/26680_1 /TAXON_ID=36898 /ORGANISM="Pyramimonas sp., Strain CCMP2087" /LENGTH=49 /DNA_ID= /DNA_START= /DNA_END= /DNA_ORIENTATION=
MSRRIPQKNAESKSRDEIGLPYMTMMSMPVWSSGLCATSQGGKTSKAYN